MCVHACSVAVDMLKPKRCARGPAVTRILRPIALKVSIYLVKAFKQYIIGGGDEENKSRSGDSKEN